jgi:hypothetical protein
MKKYYIIVSCLGILCCLCMILGANLLKSVPAEVSANSSNQGAKKAKTLALSNRIVNLKVTLPNGRVISGSSIEGELFTIQQEKGVKYGIASRIIDEKEATILTKIYRITQLNDEGDESIEGLELLALDSRSSRVTKTSPAYKIEVEGIIVPPSDKASNDNSKPSQLTQTATIAMSKDSRAKTLPLSNNIVDLAFTLPNGREVRGSVQEGSLFTLEHEQVKYGFAPKIVVAEEKNVTLLVKVFEITKNGNGEEIKAVDLIAVDSYRTSQTTTAISFGVKAGKPLSTTAFKTTPTNKPSVEKASAVFATCCITCNGFTSCGCRVVDCGMTCCCDACCRPGDPPLSCGDN